MTEKVASFHLGQFKARRSISKFVTVPAERWELESEPGCVLGKVLGTSKAGTTRLSVDIARWAIFAVWENESARTAFMERSTLLKRWRKASTSMEHFFLSPVASRGTWDKVDPFVGLSGPSDVDGPIVVLTRAAVRLTKIWTFTRAIPAVDDDLRAQPGCQMALGIGEWPVGQQATFSVWDSMEAVRAFAHNGDAHSNVIRRTYAENWYSEEMFSRFRLTNRFA